MPCLGFFPLRYQERRPIQGVFFVPQSQRMPVRLSTVKLDGFQMVIAELEVEQDYLRRAKRYLEE
jgi:hypothetical protein